MENSRNPIFRIAPNGAISHLANVPGDGSGACKYVAGEIYAVSRAGHAVYRVSLDGEVNLVAGTGQRGSADGAGGAAMFSLPFALGASPAGDVLYVSSQVSSTSNLNTLNPVFIRRITLPRQ